MKLFYAPGACSLSPHIALCEGDFQFDTDKIDMKAKKTADGSDYLALNPSGKVPALQMDDGDILTEGPAIVQYIADQAPGTELAPRAGTKERYQLQSLLNQISTEVHKAFGPLFQGAAEDAQQKARDMIGKQFGFFDKMLAQKQYLMGDHFTVADGYLYVMLRWAERMKIAIPANLATYKTRVEARPKVQTALKAEGLA